MMQESDLFIPIKQVETPSQNSENRMKFIVIGAGLAGLRAAGVASSRGHEVEVLEATDCIGGRVQTDIIDGFRCDKGFQLLNPSYPEARRSLKLSELDLHHFGRGVAVHSSSGTRVLADPFRHPEHLKGSFGAGVKLSDLAALLRWLQLSKNPSATLGETIEHAGFSPLVAQVFERFFSGVVADPSLQASALRARSLFGYFVKGTPALPTQGMAAILSHLAQPLSEQIRLSTPVRTVANAGERVKVTCSTGEQLYADRVVVAAGPRASARLLGQAEPEMNALTTWWFAAKHQPTNLPFLHLDLRDEFQLTHTSVISNICPSYAPAGQHLIQATVAGVHGLADQSAMIQAASILGVTNPDWRLLVRHDIEHALPSATPDQDPLKSQLPRIEVAGDTAQASIQGALSSAVRSIDVLEKFQS
ncbi:MAG TPA: phytoene dehydrogenase [Micrococcaceae bacterium]|nr:phytoene dehydrogenase [Micrococcaceae bacterium]